MIQDQKCWFHKVWFFIDVSNYEEVQNPFTTTDNKGRVKVISVTSMSNFLFCLFMSQKWSLNLKITKDHDGWFNILSISTLSIKGYDNNT